MPKILIITYYWPPAGGPGVQRVLKFVKYLHQFGWEPVILTVKNGEFPAIDHSLSDNIPNSLYIYKSKLLEPSSLYKKFIGWKKSEPLPVALLLKKDLNWKKRLSHWIRLNIFIPDAKIGWFVFAVRMGKHIIKIHKPDFIFSSSPPQTVQLIARRLSRWSKIPWIADFRDPWTDIYHYNSVRKTYPAVVLDKYLERKVLQDADHIVTVSKHFSILLKQKIPQQNKISVIMNGYDPDDFSTLKSLEKFERFTIAYSGKISEEQNPTFLWADISDLVHRRTDFKTNFQLLLMGNISQSIIQEIEKFGLKEHLIYTGYIHHRDVILNLSRSHILLLLVPYTQKNEGIIPGKIFEYIATGNEILGIGNPNGDAADLIKTTRVGIMVDYNTDFKPFIINQFEKWINNKQYRTKLKSYKNYSRVFQTEKLIQIMDEIKKRNIK